MMASAKLVVAHWPRTVVVPAVTVVVGPVGVSVKTVVAYFVEVLVIEVNTIEKDGKSVASV